jgi:hypothetical protein
LKDICIAPSLLTSCNIAPKQRATDGISTHLWEADLGTGWPAGRHIIEVKATDRYDRTFTAYHTMRVVSEQ